MAEEKKASSVPDGGDLKAVMTEVGQGILRDPTVEDADPALRFAEGEVIDYTEVESKKVLRKIDLALMPLLCWVYMIQFADKTSLNYASLMGIRTDANLDPNSQQYSWVSSIFYAGYIFWE